MMVGLKIIKRLLWDFWVVFFNIFEDIQSNQKVMKRLPLFHQNGFMELSPVENNELTKLRGIFNEHLDKGHHDTSGQLKGRVFSHGLLDERLLPIIERFKSVASGYLNSDNPNLELTYFQRSIPEKKVENIPGGEFHIDDTKANIKFFVYLTDVTDDHGPFSAVPGTQKWREPSRIFRAFWYALSKSRSSMYASKSKGAALSQRAKVFTGAAGTCFAVDTTAWHTASKLKTGSREVFVASFNRR